MSRTFLEDSINSELKMHECGENNYWFYHNESFPNEFPLLYKYLVGTAESNIEIWDPYFNVKGNNRDQDIFNDISENITIKILTQKGISGDSVFIQEIINALKMTIPNSKNIRFGMRVINKGDSNQKGWLFHDRYLIIDNSKVYLIGSSVGSHTKSHESTGIYKVENNNTIIFIISVFNKYWGQASAHKIDVTYLESL